MELTKDMLMVGLRVKCLWRETNLNRERPDVFQKEGLISTITDSHRVYIRWDDPSLNETMRHTQHWYRPWELFEVVECPENEKILSNIKDYLRRQEHAMKFF